MIATDGDHDVKGRFTTGNNASLRHGGAACVKAIQHNEPLTGLAAEEERRVIDDLEDGGAPALMLENAVRLQTAARLYWNGVLAVADQGNLKMLNSYIKTFGWLAGASLRAWAQVQKSGGSDDNVLDYEAILAAKREEADSRKQEA